MKANSLFRIKLRIFTSLFAMVSMSMASGNAQSLQPNAQGSQAAAKLADRIRRIENGLPPISLGEDEPPLQLTLQKLMELYQVPGLSVAVIDDFKIAWAKGYGVTEAGGTTPVTPGTLFQAGSVSKPVAATGALYLVKRGKLSLDEDVNRRLKSWKVPENEFTREQKVTLRRILSHSAGLTVHGFPGYSVDEPVPTLRQVLNGEKPANTLPVRVDFIPGTRWRYSGGGVLIEQQLMIDMSGEPFPQLMREVVFDKIGMSDSTYEQPLPAARASAAATGTYANGKAVPGRWHVYPEMAAAGLWTTSSDLARFAIEIARSKQGESNRVLSETIVREMLKVQMPRVEEIALGNEQHRDRMGLGFFLGDDTRPDLFGHIGDDEGFQAMLFMFGDSGQGVAIMANSENGILLGDYLIENIAREYGWHGYVPPARPLIGAATVLRAIAQRKGTQAAMKTYRELKSTTVQRYVPNQESLIALTYWLSNANKLQDALEVAKLEVQEYPSYWNAYDTLAEMYLNAGDKQSAIQNYEKSVELNPGNHGGIEALKRLKGQK
jgi:CubicO group peptidase (beta-lactamase class C family)